MPGVSFGGSVLKREARSIERVRKEFSRGGWTRTGSIGERIQYYEKNGINITLIGGPRGTVIIPSGPIRGSIFSDDMKVVSRTSVIGAGKNNQESSGEKRNPQRNTGGATVIQ